MKQKLCLLAFALAGQLALTHLLAQHASLTVVYDISVKKTKHSTGIEETYNGGTKAVFITPKKARVRLVSMMRMESFFFEYDTSKLKQAVVVKESGQKKYRYNLSASNWKDFNKKYEGITCDMKDDSIEIAGYKCRKAIINLSSGETIDVFYTDSIKAVSSIIEPAFSCIPGLVLQYEVNSNRGKVIFKAAQVTKDPIAKDVFIIPRTGVQAKKYIPAK
jgi:GLPGLI family protein